MRYWIISFVTEPRVKISSGLQMIISPVVKDSRSMTPLLLKTFVEIIGMLYSHEYQNR